jgi:hypothetical protein
MTTELILAVGSAGLLAAISFRYLVETVIRINRELQATLQNSQTERNHFLAQLAASQTELDKCREEIQTIKYPDPSPEKILG